MSQLITAWLERGLAFFQLRAKDRPARAYLAMAADLKARHPGARILANDFAALALSRRDIFSGLHLGQSDWRALAEPLRKSLIARARENRLRPVDENFVLGYSTHNQDELRAALVAWTTVDGLTGTGDAAPVADVAVSVDMPLWSYVAIGPLRETGSKRAGLSPVLSDAERVECLRAFGLFLANLSKKSGEDSDTFPFLVGIGGIDAENVVTLLGPGLTRVIPAVIGAALRLDILDALIKNVALLMDQNSLET